MLKSAGIQTSSHHSLQTTGAMPQSMMSDNELLSAFMQSVPTSQTLQQRQDTDALLLRQQKAEYENALQQELLRQAEQEKDKQRQQREKEEHEQSQRV